MALDFDAREITLAAIAAEWHSATGHSYSILTVRRIIAYAKERAEESQRERLAAIADAERLAVDPEPGPTGGD